MDDKFKDDRSDKKYESDNKQLDAKTVFESDKKLL